MFLSTENREILIVKLNKLGDTIAFLPTVYAMRMNYRRARLTLLTTDVGREIVKDTDLIDRVWVSTIKEVRTYSGFFKWLYIIRKNRFDAAIASSDSSSFIALLFFMAAIPIRVGFTNPKLSFLFNVKIPFSDTASHVKLNLLIAEKLGCSKYDVRPKINIPDMDRDKVLNMFKTNGVKESDRFIVMHIGVDKLHRSQRWPIERFGEVANYIHEKYSYKTIFVGSHDEKELLSSIEGSLRKDSFVNLTEKTNIKQLIYIISLARLFIGNASGPLQIAYMVGVPTISMWGAASSSNWGPAWDEERHVCIKSNLDCLGCEKQDCFKSTFECMNSITVDMVIKEVFRMFGK